MRFRSLELRNFTCYTDADVPFEAGVSVIHGVNGSGKSSLLDACFFDLYGAQTLVDRTLEEVITKGETEAEVTLAFTHAGDDYEVYRRLRRSDERAQTAACTLTTPTDTIDGARPVREAITSLLRMDADAFLNCAYVRQGEVNKLIHASPAERQDMLDELLQLGVLEEYRDRAADARRGIASIVDELTGRLDQVTAQIDEKEGQELPEQLNELATRRTEIDRHVESLTETLEEARSRRDEAAAAIDAAQDRQSELEELETDVDALSETIEETALERQRLRERIGAATDDRAELQSTCEDEHDELGVTPLEAEAVEAAISDASTRDEELRDQIETVRLELQEHARAAEQADTDAEALESRAKEAMADADRAIEDREEQRESLEEHEAERASLVDQREEILDRFAGTDVDPTDIVDLLAERREVVGNLRERASELRARIEGIEADIDEAEALVAAGRCPTCGQPIADAPVVGHIEEHHTRRDEHATELATLERRIEMVTTEIERFEALADAARRLDRLEERIEHVDERIVEHEARIESLDAMANDRRTDAEQWQEAAADHRADADARREAAAERRDRVASLNKERGTLRGRRDALETLLDRYERIGEIDETIESLRDRRAQLATLNEERRERLSELRTRLDALRDAVDDDRIAHAREVFEEASTTIEAVTNEHDRRKAQRDELIDQIGRVQNELDELRSLRTRRSALADEHRAIETVHAETAELETMYGDLRRDLRERNITVLESLLNETFALVYRNDAYASIELDREYRFTIAQKDGERLTPLQLSGGERALFNLSLRCAIYRLLAEGIEGGAPLPPLILDEPTVFLDRGHVGNLVELIEAMREIGVEQIIVVTHDTELLNAADTALRVEKEPRTNRSTVVPDDARSAVRVQE